MRCFNPQDIPESLLLNQSDDKGEFEDDLELLRVYLFVEMNNASDIFEMHRMVQFSDTGVPSILWRRRIGGDENSSSGCQRCFLRENSTIGHDVDYLFRMLNHLLARSL